ncbi:MAG TPA: protein kinase [Vicinamibacterales bacterium]|nr:protein kinase [Vicinamibacterales bacterium]
MPDQPKKASGSEETVTGTNWVGLVGTTVLHYRILEKLGEGGMGVVYKAHDEKLDRTVALKFLPAFLRDDAELKRQMVREARAASALDHPNIVVIHDIDVAPDGAMFIAMAYHEGQTLQARIRRGLSVHEAVHLARQVASGLARAHERGIFHRDVKPSNVIVSPDGIARIIDFGLAKPADATATMEGVIKGTPLYMSPEQASGGSVDQRTDVWSLGAVLYEMLSGKRPFDSETPEAVLRAIQARTPAPLRTLRPDVPDELAAIVDRALVKDPAARYSSASEMAADLARVEASFSTPAAAPPARSWRWAVPVAVVLALIVGVGGWLYLRVQRRAWVRETAIPQIADLRKHERPLAASQLLERAQSYLPQDAELASISKELTEDVAVVTTPAGVRVEIQDYFAPASDAWRLVGTTPIDHARLPDGYFRWRLTKSGAAPLELARELERKMEFALDDVENVPAGMVRVPAEKWGTMIAFLGWIGPYQLPTYDLDRLEVTNSQYQAFVDQGGYERENYWKAPFVRDGKTVAWAEVMTSFRDETGRPGPSTWHAGHFPEGRGDYPVSGISWYEAAAYAAFVNKSLPTMPQWFQASDPDAGSYVTRASNFGKSGIAPAGQFKGLGRFGTFDMAGNVREWCLNQTPAGNEHIVLGGTWKSPDYIYDEPEALPSFDRSEGNGLRLVVNHGEVPANAAAPVALYSRKAAEMKPVGDAVFSAYKSLYVDERRPLDIEAGPVVETTDWHEERVTINAAYEHARLPVVVFVPKHVKPPYQAVVFFPSARVQYLPSSETLGDMNFVDYVIQSGRVVIYPIYQATYERLSHDARRSGDTLPSASRGRDVLIQQVKDAERAVDYLEHRADVDKTKIGYLGVSMGSAAGVMVGAVEDRFKVMIWLDGGLFLDPPAQGADQVDFAPRMTKPLLMINGRYDFVFPLDTSQTPLFNLVGTPAAAKKHVVLDTPHDVSAARPEMIKNVLEWLEKYLGRVD